MSTTNSQPEVSDAEIPEARKRKAYLKKKWRTGQQLLRKLQRQKQLFEIAKKCSSSTDDILNPDTSTESRHQANMETDKVEENNQVEDITNLSSNDDDSTNTEIQETTNESLPLRIAKVLNIDSVKLSEVDKFKRRLIRSIARYMIEKVPEAEMWKKLQNDTDCDCHVLWKRMRSLTYKKLRRLLSVGDRWESVAKVARLSTTDWLLFDLLLVHEKVDFIGQDTLKENEKEPKVLKELYELVMKYNIEQLEGEDLIRAWVYLTLEYNRRGRQCSPMLLQRRWYQLKQLARTKFYSFWFAYGGTAAKLEKAWQQKPTDLQAAIASSYKFIVTDPFPEWEELVSNKKVILREDFENLSKEQPFNNKNVSDVQIIETPVETIELDEESDAEIEDILPKNTDIGDEPHTNNEKLEIRIDKIKSEAIDQSEDVQAFETMHIPIRRGNSPVSLLKSNYELQPTALTVNEVPIDLDNEVLPKITSVVGGFDLLDSANVGDAQTLVHNEDLEITAQIANLNESDNVNTSPNDNTVPNNDDISKSADETKDYEVSLGDLLIIDDGIALEDDDEVYEDDIKEDLLKNTKEESKVCLKEEEDDKIDETPKFDHKLLLTPVAYTRKLDDMSVFKFCDFNEVRDKRIIDCCYVESKPKIELCISEQQKTKENESVAPKSIELDYEGDSNTSTCINDTKRIKICSWILQKPKKRIYNPIQLCKNPDFNTRLKRLNAGFLSCERNRLLLKECKPLTIDLHKSFERKLINGKMYLKAGKFTEDLEKINTACTKELDISKISESSPVEVNMSYIVPIISPTNTFHQKIDNTDDNQNIDFNKSIGTSASDKKLLTVEVTPIQVDNIDNRPPVEIVAKQNVINSECLQDQEVANQDQTPKELDVQHNLTENPVCIDLVNPITKRTTSKHQFQNTVSKTLINGPKQYRFGYTKNTLTRETVTWNMGWKKPKNTDIFGGVLLASDTLEKMLNLLLYGNVDKKKNKKKTEKTYARKIQDLQEKIENKTEKTICMSTEKLVDGNTNTEKPIVKKRRKRKLQVPDNSQNITPLPRVEYCCWAQEKIATKTEPEKAHYCPQPICNCCCRDLLLKKSLEEKAKESCSRGCDKTRKMRLNKMAKSQKTKQNPIVTPPSDLSSSPISDLPIILSDDDDIENTPKASQKMYEISDSSNTFENINDSSHVNIEKNTINVDQNQEKSSMSEEHTSLNPQKSPLINSLEEDTSLTAHTNNKQLQSPFTFRVYSKPPSILKKKDWNTQVLTNDPPSPQLSINSQYDNHHNTKHIKTPDQHDNNELPLFRISNPHENLYSTPSHIREPLEHSSPNDSIVLTETLLNTKLPNINNSPKLPIFLGENKILLCANKALSNLETNISKISKGAQAVLPEGVQIVLLPNGELTLSIEPGKNFEIDEINKFFEILAAVQTQLNLSDKNRNIRNSSEILHLKNIDNTTNSLSQNETVCETLSDEQKSTESRLSSEAITVATPTGQQIEDDFNAGRHSTEIVSAFGSFGDSNKKISNTLEAENDNHNNATTEYSADSAVKSNKKSILHDLMEMSGISENDAVSDDKIEMNPSKETLPTVPVSTIALPDDKSAKDIDLSDIKTNLNDTVRPQSLISKVLEERLELSIVSSVVELKAGCENKCQFYKMDTVTGRIVPINIKIKKSVKRKQKLFSSTVPGPVIDLTDDTTTLQGTTSKKTVLANSVAIEGQIKPIKLIRRICPRKKLQRSLLLDRDNPTTIMPNKVLYSVLNQNALQSERSNVRKHLNKITTHKNDTNNKAKTYEDKDSDSDDEPLAKIAKRQRYIDDSDDADKPATPENSVPGEVVDDDSAEYLMPEFLETMGCESNSEETEELCILGV